MKCICFARHFIAQSRLRQASRIALNLARSLRLARLIAGFMIGAITFENPVGASVAQRHPRRIIWRGLPRVSGLHWKRSLLGTHDQPLAGDLLDELVRVPQCATEEAGNKPDP